MAAENLTSLELTGIILHTLAAGCEGASKQRRGAGSETSTPPDEKMSIYYDGSFGKPFLRISALTCNQYLALPSPAEVRSHEKHSVPCEP